MENTESEIALILPCKVQYMVLETSNKVLSADRYLQIKESTQHTSQLITDVLIGIANLTNDHCRSVLFIENNMESDCGFTFCLRYDDIMMLYSIHNQSIYSFCARCDDYMMSY